MNDAAQWPEIFSVWQFFDDGSHECVRRGADAEEAVLAAKRCTESVGGRLGFVARVIITDSDDFCCFEWQFGKGVTFK